MFGFSVGVGGLSNCGTEVRFFLLLLVFGIGGVSGSFQVLERGGDGVDDVCWVRLLLFSRAEDEGEGSFSNSRRNRGGE